MATAAATEQQQVPSSPPAPQLDISNSVDEEDELNEDDVTHWDEGGRSDCGYRDSVHETLMTMGSAIHKIVGEPSHKVVEAMNQIGNWFQEASYAVRDLTQGKMNVREETMNAVKSVVTGENMEEEDRVEEDNTEEDKVEGDRMDPPTTTVDQDGSYEKESS